MQEATIVTVCLKLLQKKSFIAKGRKKIAKKLVYSATCQGGHCCWTVHMYMWVHTIMAGENGICPAFSTPNCRTCSH